VLGNGCKRRGRPVGTIEKLESHSHMLPYESNVDRPFRDASLIKTPTQSGSCRILGYFRRVPPGQFAAYTLSLMLTRMGGCRTYMATLFLT
jgi:hypothetical protein